LFVCARGGRSETAARLAEQLGMPDVFSLEGGTHAWRAAGFAIEQPPGATAPDAGMAARAPNCGLPQPGLEIVVGNNLRELRRRRELSLDQLARLTGLSRTVLGQLELGKTSPSVATVWRIAQAFEVPFSTLLATEERAGTTVLRGADATRIASPDGRFSSRPLYPLGDAAPVEFYELFLAAHSREDARAHQPGTRESLVVTAGRVEIHVGRDSFSLATGDAIVFTADVPHAYVNPAAEAAWMYLVMSYRPPS
jgi:transcriptional regulator with XRE-family HTH domain